MINSLRSRLRLLVYLSLLQGTKAWKLRLGASVISGILLYIHIKGFDYCDIRRFQSVIKVHISLQPKLYTLACISVKVKS